MKRFIPQIKKNLPKLCFFGFCFCLLFLSSSCLKTTKILQIPARIQKAKTLSRQEIVELLRQKASKVQSLQVSSMKAYFVGGDAESGKVERYLGVPGYVLAQKPSHMRVTLQNPVTKSSLADMVSDDKEIRMWIPIQNKYFIGPADMSQILLDKKKYDRANGNPLLNLRPHHLLPALLFIDPLDSEKKRIFVEEEGDETNRYYVVGIIDTADNSENEIQLFRKIWIERFDLHVVKERWYGLEGKIQAEILYSNYQEVDGASIPFKIDLQRFPEHYSMTFVLNKVKINPRLLEKTFQLNQPAGAEIVDLYSLPKSTNRKQ
jgi:outer membrane lipoprotein-sorting protein